MKEEKSQKYSEIDHENGEKLREVQETSDLKGDYSNVVILLFLYLLQGDDYVIFLTFNLENFQNFRDPTWNFHGSSDFASEPRCVVLRASWVHLRFLSFHK